MKRTLVRYKVKADRAAENEALIRDVYKALAQDAPEGLRYAAFKLDDGVSFVHVALVDTADGENPLLRMDAFKAFQEGIRDRCEEPPAATSFDEVGFYEFFG